MRILHYSHAFFPDTGGKSTRLHNLLRDDGHVHDLYVPMPSPPSPVHESFGNIECHRLAGLRQNGVLSRIPILRRASAARRMAIATESVPDIIYGHAPALSAQAALYYRRRTHLPMLYEVHGIMCDSEVQHDARGIGAAAEAVNRMSITRLERSVLAASHVIIAQTRAVKERIQRLYDIDGERIHVVYNGVDTWFFDPGRWRDARDDVRRAREWNGVTVLLYAGFLDDINGVRRLVDAFRALPAETRAKGRLVIAGRGAEAAYIEKEARESNGAVVFLGSIPFNEIPRWYAAADVFVIPRPDTLPAQTFLPMKLLEAMAMEKTVVVSDVHAMKEVVTDGETGVVFKNADPGGLERALTRVLTAPPSASSCAAAARAHVAHTFTWNTGRDILKNAYEETLGVTTPQ